ncbi:MAG: DegT/DnrJ/EryC1/StrS family aminotransferase [Deltaproteobacteria bacterium]|nr:DegT/DnrJ/EryC1/StrS family aminotransferase [Deltaproteobacteria bacterium]
MLRRVTVAGCPISLKDLSFGLLCLFNKTYQGQLSDALLRLLDLKYVYLVNSGASSFYTILKTLKDREGKDEVIVPAYTAPSLITVIRKAGLKPVLCDISLDDFNMDVNLLPAAVSEQTLCILGVYMFGIVNKELQRLKRRFPHIFIIEDCAQSLGSKIDATFVGNSADVSIFSFNRGKNLPTYGGGCIATNSERVAEKIIEEGQSISGPAMGQKVLIALKLLGLSLAVRPFIYGLGYRFIRRFKDVTLPKDFEVRRYSDFQAAVALSLLKKIEDFSEKRYNNGIKLIEGLRDVEGIILPKISGNVRPAFNRLPIVIKDLGKRQEVEKALGKAGVDTSRMYLKPLHHIFDLGYKEQDFPAASYFAERLLTLPVHPLLTDIQLNRIIETVKNA